MTTSSYVRAVVCALSFALLAGCSTAEPEKMSPSSSQQPARDVDVPWTSVWSAADGVDLLGRSAELVRATIEAGYLAQARGTDQSFIGYVAAIGPQQYRYGDERRRAKNFGYSLEGTEPTAPDRTVLYYHLAEMRQSNSEVAATVCSYGLTPFASDAAKYLHESVAVALKKPANVPAGAAGVPDTGAGVRGSAGKAPTWDVFKPWSITQTQLARPAEVPAICSRWWKSVFPDAKKDPGTNQMTRPAGGPVAPDVAQYPEWIGPTDSR